MRRLLALLVALVPAVAMAASPIDAIARVARGSAGEALTLTFEAADCTLTATVSGSTLRIPVRDVSWSMTKQTDGSGDAVVTARCAKADCIASGKRTSRFSFRLATPAREARTALKTLKGLGSHCTR